jgi:hypothetical protein
MHKIFSDTISHGQRYLLNLVDTRKLLQFVTEHNLPHIYMFNVACGRVMIPCDVIFTLRHIISPNQWFYDETEVLPTPILFKKKRRPQEQYDPDKSAALTRLREERNIRRWSLEHDLPYISVYNIISGKYKPTYPKIRQMREIISVDLWFIYNDELKK